MATNELAIIIVNYNVKAFLHFCLQSVYAATTEISRQIIVVDNQSNDDSVSFVKKNHPNVTLIESNENVGFSRACNIGLSHSKAEYVLFLNPDMILAEDFFIKCKTQFESSENIGALGIKLLDGKGMYLPESKRGNPTPLNSFFKQVGIYRLFKNSAFINGYYLGNLSNSEIHEVDILTGAFFFSKTKIIKELDGFDEQFFMYGEDIDLSFRIQKRGFKLLYLPTSSAIHFKGESTTKSSLDYYRSFFGSMKLFVDKHYSSSGRTVFNLLLTVGILVSALFNVVKRILQILFWPLMDGIILTVGLYNIAQYWAIYFHQNPDHFDSKSLLLTVGAYALIWISSLSIHGHYHRYAKSYSTFKGLVHGLIFILIIYALIGNSLRSSRAIILLGFILASLIIPTIKWLVIHLFHSKWNNKIIVGSKNDVLLENLSKTGLKPSKSKNAFNKLYIIDEKPFHKIISEIKQLEGKIKPFFWDEKHLLLISSFDKRKPGLSLDGSNLYKITTPSAIFFKRCSDVTVSFFLVFIFPFSLYLTKKNNYYFSNIWKIICGKRTLISYSDLNERFHSELPKLKSGFWPNGKTQNNKEQLLRIKEYALHYSILKDITILVSEFKNVIGYLANRNDH